MCCVIRSCIRIESTPVAGGSDIAEFIAILNHDSASQPRFWSMTIVPFTRPFSSTASDAAPGPLAGCISPRIDTKARSPARVTESNYRGVEKVSHDRVIALDSPRIYGAIKPKALKPQTA